MPINCVAVSLQPFDPVKTTVKVVGTLSGNVVTVGVFPGAGMGEAHAYVPCIAAAAVNVEVVFGQTVPSDALMSTTGFTRTFKLAVSVPVQPSTVVAVTVYVVELSGETVTAAPESEPGCHEYVAVIVLLAERTTGAP
jgi:hypothetical protein